MIPTKRKLGRGAFVCLIVLWNHSTLYAQSPDLSSSDPIYELLDDLSRESLLLTRIAGVRPLPRQEVARLLSEALHRSKKNPISRGLSSRLERATYHFRTDIEVRGQEMGDVTAIRPFDRLRLSTRREDQDFQVENDRGRFLGHGWSGLASFEGYGTLRPGIAFSYEQEFRLEAESQGSGWDRVESRLMEGSMKLPLLGADLTLGKQSLRWGHGVHNTLILGGNASSFPALRISTRETALTFLGPARFEVLLGRLENKREVPHALLGGMRLSVKPRPEIEIGTSRTFQFGGEGRSVELGKILFPSDDGENRSEDREEKDPSNQLAGFDMRLEPGLGLTLYGEAIGDDITGGIPGRYSLLSGLQWSHPFGIDDFVLTFEWARTHPEAYVHNVYRSGYNYRDFPLGHQLGRDGQDLFVSARWNPSAALSVEVSHSTEVRNIKGRIFPVNDFRNELRERQHHTWLNVGCELTRDLELHTEFRWIETTQVDFVRGERDRAWRAEVSIQWWF